MIDNPLKLRLSKIKSIKNTLSFYKERIKKYNHLLNAFLHFPDFSDTDDREDGFPFALKDNILALGTKTTCASKILNEYYSPYDATVTHRLRANGGIVLGKTNLDEFAMGSSTENSAFGPSRNPWDLDRIPGGSSGGSAAAVSAGLSPFALGSDTGGSVRQPAAMCGIVGFKPTYGLVSRYGLVAFASSLDQIGPMTRCSQDAADVMAMIVGRDPMDSTSIESPISFERVLDGDLKGSKMAIPLEMLNYPGLEDGVRLSFLSMVERLRESGVIVEEVSVPSVKYSVATYYLIAPAEASSNLSRYDSVKYGSRRSTDSYHELVNTSRDKDFGNEVKRRILLGTFTLSAAYYDAYYRKALKTRKLITRELNSLLETYDYILNPASPIVAPKIGEISDPLSYYLMDIYTIPANIAGLPSVSIPMDPVAGLPAGILLTGKRFSDIDLLDKASGIERLSSAFENGLSKIPERWLK